MTKQDHNRVEEIRKSNIKYLKTGTVRHPHDLDVKLLLSLVDKQGKVIEATKWVEENGGHAYYCCFSPNGGGCDPDGNCNTDKCVCGVEEFRIAVKELEGEK